ncbi:MAG: 23S rRNA (cytidine(2498)-2'-O)-methyltransferase RlmM, partial [Bdellovibrionota bacterium]
MTYSIIIYCRSGFENEAASEIIDRAKSFQIEGYAKAKLNSAYILFYTHNPQNILDLWKHLNIHNLIFARQVLLCFDSLNNLPEGNRIEPIIASCEKINALIDKDKVQVLDKLFVEVPDTNEHKELLTFCKKFSTPLQIQLEKKGVLKRICPNPEYNLHILFLESKTCYLAISDIKKCSPHFMGIPRLKFPKEAPSRSALKLEEAFLFFLSETQQKMLLKNGMQAVDLGASPGGWTYQFMARNMLVTSVDNANMAQNLLDSGLVTHVKADGFKYIPP